MSLLRKASIVTTPTAYENGKILSVKPVQSLGVEQIENGNFATDTDWSKGTGWTISGGKANVNATSNTDLGQNVGSSVGKTYKITFEVSNYVSGSVKVLLGYGSTPLSPALTATANGIYETEAIPNAVNPQRLYISTQTSTTNLSIDNVSVKEVLDADFDFTRNSSATRVNSQGLIEDITSNLPRIDYTGGVGHWLFEPQSTNLITQSEAFDNAYYAKIRSTISTDQIVSPDGTQNADKFIEDSALGTKLLWTQDEVVSIGNVITWSVFAKKGERDWVLLKDTNAGNFSGYFDLENGVVGSTTSLDSSKIEDLGSGWYRCSITYTSTTTTARGRLYLADANNGESYQGNGTSGLYIWGAQLEEGSYATSYIPTSGAISTRLKDAAFGAGSSDLINSTQGVLYAEIAALADDVTNRRITLSDGTNENRVVIGYNTTSNRIFYFIIVGGSAAAVGHYTSSDITQFSKVAVLFKLNDYALWVDGVERHTDTSGTIFSADTLSSLQFRSPLQTANFYGNVKNIQVFTEAKSDEFLAALTTI